MRSEWGGRVHVGRGETAKKRTKKKNCCFAGGARNTKNGAAKGVLVIVRLYAQGVGIGNLPTHNILKSRTACANRSPIVRVSANPGTSSSGTKSLYVSSPTWLPSGILGRYAVLSRCNGERVNGCEWVNGSVSRVRAQCPGSVNCPRRSRRSLPHKLAKSFVPFSVHFWTLSDLSQILVRTSQLRGNSN